MLWAPITILIVGAGVFFLAREIYFSTHGPKVSHQRHEEILTRWNYCRANGIKWDWRKEWRAAGLKCVPPQQEDGK